MYHVTMAMDVVCRSKSYVPRPFPDMLHHLLRQAVANLAHSPVERVVRFAALVMYYVGARQSELTPRSAATFDPTEVASCSYTRYGPGTCRVTTSPVTSGSEPCYHLCPLAAFRTMVSETATTSPHLVYPADGASRHIFPRLVLVPHPAAG